ncbi:MAG: hypothetical protein QOJ51_960, partial [Acidobacteriaceae bacterium]|nr:hypothetical protein [Acidobacteriaceae bacterium]
MLPAVGLLLNGSFLNLWATDREQTEGVERAAVQLPQ